MSKLIVFEGICTSGKTTSSSIVARDLNYLYNKGVFSETKIGKELKSEARYGENLSDVLYLSDLIIDTNQNIKPALEKGQIVIQDRYFDSVLAYSKAFSFLLNEKYDISYLLDKLVQNKLLIPCDVIFYFFAEEYVLLERMKKEKSFIHDIYIEKPELMKCVLSEYDVILRRREEQGIKVVKIDTTNASIEQTINRIKLTIL